MSRFDGERGFALAEFKADGPAGEFEAIVSVFGNVDLGRDRVMPGAFAKSLGRWQESGDPIPVIWNHMWDLPEAHIGTVDPTEAVETDAGLMVKGRIDMDNPFAAQVFRLLSQRRVKEFSFGYNVKQSERDAKGVNELLELDLIEVGPTLKGMNPATELLAVKALADVTPDAAPDAEPAPMPDDDSPTVDAKSAAPTIQQAIDLLTSLLPADRQGAGDEQPADEAGKSTSDDSVESKAVDLDEDLRTQINLLRST